MKKNAPPVDDPKEQPYPGYAREAAALAGKVERARRAASAPLPGALREAFAADPPKRHGFTLQPVTLNLNIILQRIESPLLGVLRVLREELAREDGADISTPALAERARQGRMAIAQARIAKEVAASPQQHAETVYAFLVDGETGVELLDAGRAKFTRAALAAVGKLHPLQFAELERACSAWYVQSFNTLIEYEAPRAPNDTTVFTPPPPITTASVGGSKLSGS